MGAEQRLCKRLKRLELTGKTAKLCHTREKPTHTMTKAKEMKSEEVLRVELEVLKREHRDLDEAIDALAERAGADQLMLRRLKKQKLALKDKISRIEDKLTPDIIA